MMKYTFVISYLNLLWLLTSCVNTSTIEHEMETMMSAPICMPMDSLEYFRIDTVNMYDEENPMTDEKFRLIIYTDSSGCSSCRIGQITLWYPDLISIEKKYGGSVNPLLLFSTHSSNVSDLKAALEETHFDLPVYIDSCGTFERNNPQIPHNSKMHIFLVNKEWDVILVGNPFENEKILNLFDKIVKNINN